MTFQDLYEPPNSSMTNPVESYYCKWSSW